MHMTPTTHNRDRDKIQTISFKCFSSVISPSSLFVVKQLEPDEKTGKMLQFHFFEMSISTVCVCAGEVEERSEEDVIEEVEIGKGLPRSTGGIIGGGETRAA